MTCERCRGWMVRDRFVDLSDDTGQLGFDGWRCLNCGEILDEVVLQHRREHPLNPYRGQRRWGSLVVRGGIAESNKAFTETPASPHGECTQPNQAYVGRKKLVQPNGPESTIPARPE